MILTPYDWMMAALETAAIIICVIVLVDDAIRARRRKRAFKRNRGAE